MSLKKHISLFLVLFITCSTSIRDQHGRQVTHTRLPLDKYAHTSTLLAQIKVQQQVGRQGCSPVAVPGSTGRRPLRLFF